MTETDFVLSSYPAAWIGPPGPQGPRGERGPAGQQGPAGYPGGPIPDPLTAALSDAGGQFFNVKAYGATGDGLTDDVPFIQDTIDAATADGGGIVYFPPGTYRLATVPSSGQGIFGPLLENLTFMGVGGNATLDIRGYVAPYRVFDLRGSHDIRFTGLRVLGDWGTTVNVHQGLAVSDQTEAQGTRSYNLTFDNCLFENLASGAVRLGPNTNRVFMYANIVKGGMCNLVEMSGIDTWGPVTNVSIVGNTMEVTLPLVLQGLHAGDDMIDIFGGCHNIAISGNTFLGNGTITEPSTVTNGIVAALGTVGATVSNLSISGNTFKDIISNGTVSSSANGGAVLLKCASLPTANNLRGTTITGNTFENCRHGILVDAGQHGVLVSGNTLRSCRRAIVITTTPDAVLTGNVIDSPTDLGVHLFGDRHVFSGNKILNASVGTGWALYVVNGNDTLINGNEITGSTQNGIVVDGTSARVQILNNVLRDHATRAIRLTNAGCTNAIIRGNLFANNGTTILDAGTGTRLDVVEAAASTTAMAGLKVPHGAVPTSPADGDIWTTATGLFVRINGVTRTVTFT